jgi:ribosomal protein S18 acetylase RimI-like enzyme
MSDLLARLRELERAATAAPWRYAPEPLCDEDAEFVVAARNALPVLLDIVEAAQPLREYDFGGDVWQRFEWPRIDSPTGWGGDAVALAIAVADPRRRRKWGEHDWREAAERLADRVLADRMMLRASQPQAERASKDDS